MGASEKETRRRSEEIDFDVMKIIANPLDSLRVFKMDILECLLKNIDNCDFEFLSLKETGHSVDRFSIADPVVVNAPDVLWNEDWQREYEKTCIYNPNRNKLFSGTGKSVFKISDFMTYSDYEKSRNYQELLRPHGYFYSMVVFFKWERAFIGQITMLRRREDGDFTRGEVERMERISPFIRNRLLDYKNVSEISLYKDLFFEHISRNDEGLLLMNSDYRVVSGNELALAFCEDLFGSYMPRGECLQIAANTVIRNFLVGKAEFKMEARSGCAYYFSTKPCIVSTQDSIVLREVMLVYIGRGKQCTGQVIFGLENNSALTPRQKEIVRLIACGMTNREIAETLIISEGTVRKHVENIREVLGAKNRIEIINKAGQ